MPRAKKIIARVLLASCLLHFSGMRFLGFFEKVFASSEYKRIPTSTGCGSMPPAPTTSNGAGSGWHGWLGATRVGGERRRLIRVWGMWQVPVTSFFGSVMDVRHVPRAYRFKGRGQAARR